MAAVVEASVVAVQQLSPSFVRISFAGCGAVSSGGYDHRIKLLLARPGQDGPVLPEAEDWYGSWCAMPHDTRPVMRTFTIRSQDGDLLDVEFALHGDAGPASAFARGARPGDRLGIIGASPGEERLAMHYAPGDARSFLLVGDDTALPAVASILEALPATASARVFLQVPDAGDIRELSSAADVEVSWSVRTGLADAVRRGPLPGGTPYAWVAGESALVRDVRSYLVGERGWSPKANYFGGYWKAGETE